MGFFNRKSFKAPALPTPSPEAPAKSGTVVLTWHQLETIFPALGRFMKAPVDPESMGQIYDTLRNSYVLPPRPWSLKPCQFDHIVMLPQTGGGVVMFFIFYPI